jgi:hypothetical protein
LRRNKIKIGFFENKTSNIGTSANTAIQAGDIAFSGGCLGPQIALVNWDEADTEVNIAIRADGDDARMEV